MSLVIYKLSDRIHVTIGEASFKLSPLSHFQRTHILSFIEKKESTELQNNSSMAFYAAKYSIKEVKGVITAGGGEYKLEFDEDGSITEACASEILSLKCGQALTTVLARFLNEYTDPKIKGVEIVLPGAQGKSKKKTK